MTAFRHETRTQYAAPEFPPQLVDCAVRIGWRRMGGGEPPWECYRVLAVHGEWVRLQGVHDDRRPRERTTQGAPWWSRVEDVESIEEMPEDDA